MESGIAKEIRLILGGQSQSPKPSAEVCLKISNLRDLYEIHGMSIASEWRGRGVESPGKYRFKAPESPRRLGSGGETPMSRVSSQGTFTGTPISGSGTPPPPIAKYQSRFKNSQQPVEDKILNNIILSKLNKFSPKTYNEIRDFLYQILGSGGSEVEEIVPHFIKLVFRKAAIEKIFCPLYAKLLSEISSRYGIILKEMQALQANYLKIFDDISEPESNSYDNFVEAQKSKEFRHGYSQFLAELTALELLNLDLLNSTFQCILGNMVHFGKLPDNKALLEEYSDCLVSMAKVLKKRPGHFFSNARSTLLKTNETCINDLINNHTNYESETAKTRFILMDIYDILKGL
jgi:hypothetical protein